MCVSRTREGSDLKDWEEALASLQTTGDARAIGKQLRDWAQHPEISPVPAWKFVQAAHVVNEKPDKATWAFFMGVVRRASRREFEAWHDPPAHDPAFPAPKPRAAPTRSVPTVSDDQKAEIIRKLKERTARRDARCG